jgi:acyl homoserine lactone synthase
MLEIVQTGQGGKSRHLFEMHRLRKRVFKDRMGWDVNISPSGMETDQFDLPESIYLLALDDGKRVVGNWRLLPASGPTMIRDVWPQFLNTISMPFSDRVWEASRFAVDVENKNSEEGLALLQSATQELFCGLTELCILCGIREVYTMYDMRIARLLKRLDCPPCTVSERLRIGDYLAQVGSFTTDIKMLSRLRASTGINHPLIDHSMFPPLLRNKNVSRSIPTAMEAEYATAE